MEQIGGFEVSPYLNKNRDIIGWSAYRYGRIQYVMDNPNDINDFIGNISALSIAADFFYKNGTPSDGQIAMVSGDIGLGLLQQWGEALRNPGYYMYVATVFGTAAITAGSRGTILFTVQ